jgi:hypothetical protein
MIMKLCAFNPGIPARGGDAKIGVSRVVFLLMKLDAIHVR